jgi:hypothetical protein
MLNFLLDYGFILETFEAESAWLDQLWGKRYTYCRYTRAEKREKRLVLGTAATTFPAQDSGSTTPPSRRARLKTSEFSK